MGERERLDCAGDAHRDGKALPESPPGLPARTQAALLTVAAQAMLNEMEHYGEGLYACVMDSYDYDHALDVVLPR